MKKSKSLIWVLAITICAVVFYAVQYVRTPVELMTAKLIQQEEAVTGDAYFVWNERVYTAAGNGTIYHYADEGARVGKDRLISTVYNGQVPEETLQEINNIDKKIQKLEGEQQKSSLYVDEYTMENRVENIKNQIIAAVQSNDIEKISEYKAELKAIYSGNEPKSTADELARLKSEKAAKEQQLGQSKNDIYSDCSGVFSRNIDGLESTLRVDQLETCGVSEFISLPKTDQQVPASAAVSGDAVCKVIDNHTWYTAVLIDENAAEQLVGRKTVKIHFDRAPGVEIDASVLRLSDPTEGKRLAVLRCDQYADGIFSLRESGVELILEKYQGFRVPVSAIRVEDGQKGVMVKKGGAEIFKPCEIVYTDHEREELIITPVKDAKRVLEEYDHIIIGEKWKKENNQ